MSDGLWMSVSEIAAARGVSKQAVSKRLAHFEGRVGTRKDGAKLMVNVAEYDRVTGAETDPAQDLRNRDVVKPAAEPRGDNLASKVYSQQRAKREAYEAEKARLDLEERLGKLVPVVDVEAAMVRCAEVMIRSIDQLPSKSDDPVVRAFLKETAADLRKVIAENMRLAAGDGAANEEEGDSE